MIIKGSARGGAGELATHLLRRDTNERVTVLEMTGVASLDLRGALTELDYMGMGSRSERRLYHASVNTPAHEPLSFVEQHRARERFAEEFGLTKQPYVMVEHIKHGRQHLHIVWSRVDPETGKAISDSHNFRRHEIVSRDLALEFGRTPVAGVHLRDKTREPRPPRCPGWGEQLQSERSGISPAEVKQKVTAIWQAATTGHDFLHGLEAEGFIVARGNRRDYVLVDRAGELHGLTKRIDGARARDVRERLTDIDAEQFPSVDEARRLVRQRQHEQHAANTFGAVGTAERQRAEELKREAEARTAAGPRLSGFHQEAADAIWQLKKTMRTELEASIASPPTRETLAAKLEREAEERGARHEPPALLKPQNELRKQSRRGGRVRRIEDDIPFE